MYLGEWDEKRPLPFVDEALPSSLDFVFAEIF